MHLLPTSGEIMSPFSFFDAVSILATSIASLISFPFQRGRTTREGRIPGGTGQRSDKSFRPWRLGRWVLRDNCGGISTLSLPWLGSLGGDDPSGTCVAPSAEVGGCTTLKASAGSRQKAILSRHTSAAASCYGERLPSCGGGSTDHDIRRTHREAQGSGTVAHINVRGH